MRQILSNLEARLLAFSGTETNHTQDERDRINLDFVNECQNARITVPDPRVSDNTIEYVYYDDFRVNVSSQGLQINIGPTKTAAAVHGILSILQHNGFTVDTDPNGYEYDRRDRAEDEFFERARENDYDSGDETPPRSPNP